MRKTLTLITLIIIAFSSCKKNDYSALEGKWYNSSRSWYIEFSGHDFSGESNGRYFGGVYYIKGKRISFTFTNDAPDGQEVFYDRIQNVNSYKVGKNQLKLYGYNYEIQLIR